MPAGEKWPDDLRARALELVAEGMSYAEVRKTIARQFDRTPPATSTLRTWVAAARVNRSARPPEKGATVEEMNVERNRRLVEDRERLSVLILDRLSRPSAELIADRLRAEVEEVQPRIDAARVRLEQALELLDGFSDSGPDDELKKAAERQVRTARLIYEAERGFAIPVRDLVGILTRSVADHLLLEGMADVGELDAAHAITVELVVPRADPAKALEEAVPEHELGETPR